MNRLRLIILAGLLALLQACATLPGQNADIDAVLNASGLDTQLELLKQPLSTEKMDGPLAMIPDKWITLVNATIADTLKPEQIRAELKANLGKNLSGRELHDVQKFYESATGHAVVAVESGRPEKTSDTIVIENGNDSDSHKNDTTNNSRNTSSNNRDTLDALATATGAGKAMSILAEHGLNDAVDIAVRNGCFGLDKIPFAGMLIGVVKKAQLNALRQSVNASVRDQYAHLLPAEQSAYLAFVQTTAGQKFLAARTSVISNAARQTGDALSTTLGQRIREVCATSEK